METQLAPNPSMLHAEADPLEGLDNSQSASNAARIPDRSDVARESTEGEAAFRVQISSRSSSIEGFCLGNSREGGDVLLVRIPSGKPSDAQQATNGPSGRVVERRRSQVSVSLSETSVSTNPSSTSKASGDEDGIRRE